MKSIFSYDGRGIQDDLYYNSEEMKSFSRRFRNFLKKTFENDDITIVNYSLGHYDISGFLRKDGMYVYFNYEVPRHGVPIDMKRLNLLIRLAKDERDYRGEMNHFTNFYEIHDAVLGLFKRQKTRMEMVS